MRDVIVVLGSPNDDDGALSPQARARVAKAVEIHHERPGSALAPTGGFGAHFNRSALPHHEHVRSALLRAGVAPGAILAGLATTSTADDARACARLEADALVVVTSEFHMPRATAVFRRALPDRTLEFAAAANGVAEDAVLELLDHEIAALASMLVPSDRFLLQMSGAPGSGKSTLARAVARATGAVVVDHDVTKTGLLEAGVAFATAGRLSYFALLAVADDLVAQGRDVIVDSPCAYRILLARGLGVAAAHGVAYRFVECVCDPAVVERRRAARPRRASHSRPGATSPPRTEHGHVRERVEPPVRWLRVDTAAPPDEAASEVAGYLRS